MARADSVALKGHLATPGDSFGRDTVGEGSYRLQFLKAKGAAEGLTRHRTASHPARPVNQAGADRTEEATRVPEKGTEA